MSAFKQIDHNKTDAMTACGIPSRTAEPFDNFRYVFNN
jgi:hypothetical protein